VEAPKEEAPAAEAAPKEEAAPVAEAPKEEQQSESTSEKK
jgi:large subunit ribosomal protein L19